MEAHPTERQSPEEQQRARELSRQRAAPPMQVPGYDMHHLLGAGAYGEVWVAVDRNTGRRVAIKFYAHRGSLDGSLLSREVEKLVFLSADRYVVQLLDVGWDTERPYYVMEYMEHGSLEQYLARHGRLSVHQAVEVFHEITTGLLHAHGKGVLHCDLKPANILLDQDFKPRLADFGQSRLSHEQRPALGTLFYMAPEQADLEAVPDARWDVYALGALLFCMLTGQPPHRRQLDADQLDSSATVHERLAHYRERIASLPPVTEHRRVPRIDRALVEIIDRCLDTDPERRFSNVQSVLTALEAREAARYRRPLMLLGLVGPLLLLAITMLFGYLGYHRAVQDSERMLAAQALESNRFNARFVAEAVARRIDRYFRAVEQRAEQPELISQVQKVLEHPELSGLLRQLRTQQQTGAAHSALVNEFAEHPARLPLQRMLEQWISDAGGLQVASWFVVGPRGIHLAAAFAEADAESPVGGDFSWRTYFHGGPVDLPPDGPRPPPIRHMHLSSVFQSTATNHSKIAISAPLWDDQGTLLGVMALTVDLGRVVDFPDESERLFTVLVDGRPGTQQGMILEHPLYRRMLESEGRIADRLLKDYRVPIDRLGSSGVIDYRDPLGRDRAGGDFRNRWIAAKQPVRMRPVERPLEGDQDTGLVVIVQQDYASVTSPVRSLGQWLLGQGVLAMCCFAGVVVLLWYAVRRGVAEKEGRPQAPPTSDWRHWTSRPPEPTESMHEGEQRGAMSHHG